MKIGIIGAGAWGTALAIHFAKHQHECTLLTKTAEDARQINDHRENRQFFEGFALPQSLQVKVLSSEIAQADLLLMVVPTQALRSVLQEWVKPFAANTPILAACKGFEQNTGYLPHQILHDVLPENNRLGLLSGPSFAQELAQSLPCAVSLASVNSQWIASLAQELNTSVLRLYSNHDPIGVAVGGAVKNVIAIACGIVDGLQYGLNARAALLTRGLAEITRLAVALGADEKTMVGLSGMGDLILTATGSLSRNRQVGLKLAEGKALPQILAELGHVAEGIHTVSEVVRQARARSIEMPITFALQSLLDGEYSAAEVVEQLMQREPKTESSI